MKEFISDLRYMYWAKKHMKNSEQSAIEYQYYRHLVKWKIYNFFSRFIFWGKNNELPF